MIPPIHLILKRVGKLIILVTATNIKFVLVKPVVTPLHRLIHNYEEKKLESSISRFNLIGELLRNPISALNLPGSKKISLFILLAFREYHRGTSLFSSIFSEILKNANKVRKRQKWILKLLAGRKKHLRQLLNGNPVVFFEFMTRFINSQTFSRELDVLYGTMRLLDADLSLNTSDVKIHPEVKIHSEFCMENCEETVIFTGEYKNFISNIKKRKIFNGIIKPANFYPEIHLYNSFLMWKMGIGSFDHTLLDHKFVTKNEKLVKAYVMNRIKMKGH